MVTNLDPQDSVAARLVTQKQKVDTEQEYLLFQRQA